MCSKPGDSQIPTKDCQYGHQGLHPNCQRDYGELECLWRLRTQRTSLPTPLFSGPTTQDGRSPSPSSWDPGSSEQQTGTLNGPQNQKNSKPPSELGRGAFSSPCLVPTLGRVTLSAMTIRVAPAPSRPQTQTRIDRQRTKRKA